jgi:hypothetical protein
LAGGNTKRIEGTLPITTTEQFNLYKASPLSHLGEAEYKNPGTHLYINNSNDFLKHPYLRLE